MRPFYWGLFLISCLGLSANFVVHIRALFGVGVVHWMLFFGSILLLAVPEQLARNELTGSLDPMRESEQWTKAYFGSWQEWMRKTNYVLFGYFILIFTVFTIKHYSDDFYSHSGPLPPAVAVLFSAGGMCFYWTFICTLWAVLHRYPHRRKCPNGHLAPYGQNYCDECGARVSEPSRDPRSVCR